MATEIMLLRAAAGLYLAATVAALVGIAVRRDFPSRLFLWLVGGGLVLHAISIVIRSALVGHLPVANFGEGLSLLAVLLVAIFLVVQRRGPLIALGAVVMPLAFGLTLTASVTKGGAQPLPAMLQSIWLPVHVLLALLGDAVFAIACSASVLYLVQERRLKAHRGLGALHHLPSLERLDQVSHTCLKWGLILLTLAIVSGIVWAHEAWGRGDWVRDPKLLFSLLVWALYTVLLQGRMTAGWRGRWAAQLTIAGFAVIVVSLVSVNLLRLGLHGGAF
jgi:cytochrome c-type biogenesis protein CcsB